MRDQDLDADQVIDEFTRRKRRTTAGAENQAPAAEIILLMLVSSWRWWVGEWMSGTRRQFISATSRFAP
jgi:hypothetical protein